MYFSGKGIVIGEISEEDARIEKVITIKRRRKIGR
jgi:hypothetical protein